MLPSIQGMKDRNCTFIPFSVFLNLAQGGFMIDPAAILQGVISGLSTQKSIQLLDRITSQGQPSKDDIIIMLLARLVEIQSPQEVWNRDTPMALQPAPYEYLIDENWKGKSHFCIFVPVQSSITVFTEGAGVYNNPTTGPGWVQVDLRGRMYSGDALNHNVILSYRDDAIGKAF